MEQREALSTAVQTQLLTEAPAELTNTRLRRLGEGIGKVVYASDHWVVKRERSPSEILGLIVVWRSIRKAERMLPGGICQRLLEKPSRQIRLLRVFAQASMAIVPKAIWFSTHIRQVWKQYYVRSRRGERLAQQYIDGTGLAPERIEFPPTRVSVRGWPGWLTVEEATERVECTLYERLRALASNGEFEELENWLDRFLNLRQAGWRRGVFSADAHLKNFGVIGSRIVLLDSGGLTNRWPEIERQLAREETVEHPHKQLGLSVMLEARQDIAQRFDLRWRATVNREAVRKIWPEEILSGKL